MQQKAKQPRMPPMIDHKNIDISYRQFFSNVRNGNGFSEQAKRKRKMLNIFPF